MAAKSNCYKVLRCSRPPSLLASPGRLAAGWRAAERGSIGWYHQRSSHRPAVAFRLLYDDHALYVRFDVRDRYVRSLRTEPQSSVCRDSCVEFFVQPLAGRGYFNFEINAGGALLLYFIENCRRVGSGFAKWQTVAPEWHRQVAIAHSLPSVVEPEITAPVTWTVAYRLPLALFTAYLGKGGVAAGDIWHANFFKCGDETSHPHWGAWNPITGKLDFHKPSCFGELRFDLPPKNSLRRRATQTLEASGH